MLRRCVNWRLAAIVFAVAITSVTTSRCVSGEDQIALAAEAFVLSDYDALFDLTDAASHSLSRAQFLEALRWSDRWEWVAVRASLAVELDREFPEEVPEPSSDLHRAMSAEIRKGLHVVERGSGRKGYVVTLDEFPIERENGSEVAFRVLANRRVAFVTKVFRPF